MSTACLIQAAPCAVASADARPGRFTPALHSGPSSAFRSAKSVSLGSCASARAATAALRAGASVSRARGLHVKVRAAGGPPSAAQPAEDFGIDIAKVKQFLEGLPALGSIRLIVNTGVSVLESVTTFDGLFYSPVPGKGEYANLIKGKENVDFHLLISKVASAKFESTPGRGGNYMSYVIRVTDIKGDVCVSFFLMWPEGAERGKYAAGQVEAFEALQKKWLPSGDTISFKK